MHLRNASILLTCAGLALVLSACGSVTNSADAGDENIDAAGAGDATETPDAVPSTYTVSGSVTGFAGRNFVLQLNGGDDLEVAADGTFTFSAPLDDDTAFAVTVLSEPICPQRFCTLGNDTGTVAGANVTNVTVACAEPKYRFASHSWGDDAVRVTDDIQALEDNSTATPRSLVGNLTNLGLTTMDAIAVDSSRDLIYAPVNSALNVWLGASTVMGNVAPTRSITIASETNIESVELDEARDRLYLTSLSQLYILDNASTLDGEVVPTASITLASPETVSLDRINDRLYVGGDYTEQLFVFDNASTLTSSSTPNRTISWENPTTGFNGPPGVAIDGCNDRLYLGSNSQTLSGYNLVVFDSASTLDGSKNLETDSQAQYDNDGCITLDLDSAGRLYCWPDSPTQVRIFNNPENWSGVVTPTIDKTINGVVASGYGMDVVPY